MKRFANFAAMLAIGTLLLAAVAGCSNKAEHKKTETTSGPGGKTTTESKETVKTTGDNPPPAK